MSALVGVGYGGIRIVSRDGGKTWGDRAYETTNGGDDDVLLRAVAYGKGIWVATGWKLWTSTDGIHWTDHGKLGAGPLTACSIVEGLAYKDGWFFAACVPWNAPGAVYRSSDGLVWTKHATIGDTGGHLFLTYRGGKLVAYGDTKTSFQSDDGLTWTVMPGVEQATYCGDSWKSQTDCQSSSWFDGVYLRSDWQGKISRSTDGSTFAVVYQDDQKNTLYQSRAIAAGLVPPSDRPGSLATGGRHRATVDPTGVVGEVAGSRAGAAVGVVNGGARRHQPGQRVLAQGRAGRESHRLLERLHGAPQIVEAVHPQPSELEGGQTGPGIARVGPEQLLIPLRRLGNATGTPLVARLLEELTGIRRLPRSQGASLAGAGRPRRRFPVGLGLARARWLRGDRGSGGDRRLGRAARPSSLGVFRTYLGPAASPPNAAVVVTCDQL